MKLWEFKELKEKKGKIKDFENDETFFIAIYMGTNDTKIFYRVQNMGIIYWDYETEEVIKVKIAIEGSSFYNAV